MLQQETPDDYVVATGVAHSVKDLVREAFGHAGLDWEKHVRIDPRFLRPAEVDHLIGDPSKARRVLGWEPSVDFAGLVRMMVDADLARLSQSPGRAASRRAGLTARRHDGRPGHRHLSGAPPYRALSRGGRRPDAPPRSPRARRQRQHRRHARRGARGLRQAGAAHRGDGARAQHRVCPRQQSGGGAARGLRPGGAAQPRRVPRAGLAGGAGRRRRGASRRRVVRARACWPRIASTCWTAPATPTT